MGKQIRIDRVDDGAILPDSRYFTQGSIWTISDLEYSRLPTGFIGTYATVLNGSVADPIYPSAPATMSYRNGALAARGTAPTYANSFYFATDDNGGTLYWSDGTSWAAQGPGLSASGYGQQVASATISANFTTTSTTDVDVTGLSVNWTAVAGAVYKIRFKGAIGNTASGASVTLDLTDSANTVLDSVGYSTKSANDNSEIVAEADVTPSAGSVTYKARLHASTSTAFVLAGATYPARLNVTRVG